MLNNNIPGAGSIADAMDFMRKMWGSMGAPNMGIPSLSVEEINKKITDLKTVASWLELNMNMLRATIQTLEVQSATLSTLQSMGAILTPQPPASAEATATTPFSFSGWPTAPQATPRAQAKPDARPVQPEPRVEDMEDDEGDAQQGWDLPPDQGAPQEAAQTAASADAKPAAVNPNAWWNLLQDQFQQAVGKVLADQGASASAAADTSASAAAAPGKTTKPKATAKPRTRAKSPVVQSGHSKPASSKKKSP